MKMLKTMFSLFCFSLLMLANTPCRAYVTLSSTQTAHLMAQTSDDILQAYDLLEQLKKRTSQLEDRAEQQMGAQGRLPRNLDAIRGKILKSRLIKVLSATPFSNPEKHLADSADAIEALKEYMAHLKKVLGNAASVVAEPLASAPDDTNKQVVIPAQAGVHGSPVKLRMTPEALDDIDPDDNSGELADIEELEEQSDNDIGDEYDQSNQDNDQDGPEEQDDEEDEPLPSASEPRGAVLAQPAALPLPGDDHGDKPEESVNDEKNHKSQIKPGMTIAGNADDDQNTEMPPPLPLPGEDTAVAQENDTEMPPPLPLPGDEVEPAANTADENEGVPAMPAPEPLTDKKEEKAKKKARTDELPELPM